MTITELEGQLSKDRDLMALFFFLDLKYRQANGECDISIREIGRWMGMESRTVKVRLDALEEMKLIKIDYTKIPQKLHSKLTYVIDCVSTSKTPPKKEPLHKNSTFFTQSSALKTIDQKKEFFKNMIAPYVEEFGRDICNNFYTYWAEVTKDGKHLRWEMQDSWEIELRLARFRRNNN